MKAFRLVERAACVMASKAAKADFMLLSHTHRLHHWWKHQPVEKQRRPAKRRKAWGGSLSCSASSEARRWRKEQLSHRQSVWSRWRANATSRLKESRALSRAPSTRQGVVKVNAGAGPVMGRARFSLGRQAPGKQKNFDPEHLLAGDSKGADF